MKPATDCTTIIQKITASAQDTCEVCSVQVDKQIKCGAGSFIDVGFVTNNEDGTASCLAWNAFTANGTSIPIPIGSRARLEIRRRRRSASPAAAAATAWFRAKPECGHGQVVCSFPPPIAGQC